jgi:ketosteroid isomerase-like protein
MKSSQQDSGEWLRKLFAAIDDKDVLRFLAFLADDARFRFGNLPPCEGKQAVGAAVGAFFDAIDACRHELESSWAHADSIVCHGRVTYTRHDGSRLTVPFANVLMLRNGLIGDYLIFADTSALFGASGNSA